MLGRKSPWEGLGDAVKSGISAAVDAKTMDVMSQKIANMQSEKMVTDQVYKTGQFTEDQQQALHKLFGSGDNPWLKGTEGFKYGAGVVGEGASALGGILRGIFGGASKPASARRASTGIGIRGSSGDVRWGAGPTVGEEIGDAAKSSIEKTNPEGGAFGGLGYKPLGWGDVEDHSAKSIIPQGPAPAAPPIEAGSIRDRALRTVRAGRRR
jgi:hypothetical protein